MNAARDPDALLAELSWLQAKIAVSIAVENTRDEWTKISGSCAALCIIADRFGLTAEAAFGRRCYRYARQRERSV